MRSAIPFDSKPHCLAHSRSVWFRLHAAWWLIDNTSRWPIYRNCQITQHQQSPGASFFSCLCASAFLASIRIWTLSRGSNFIRFIFSNALFMRHSDRTIKPQKNHRRHHHFTMRIYDISRTLFSFICHSNHFHDAFITFICLQNSIGFSPRLRNLFRLSKRNHILLRSINEFFAWRSFHNKFNYTHLHHGPKFWDCRIAINPLFRYISHY